MHPATEIINGIIEQVPNYSKEQLFAELNAPTDELLSVAEAGKLLKVSKGTLQSWIHSELIKPKYLGGNHKLKRFWKSELLLMLKERANG